MNWISQTGVARMGESPVSHTATTTQRAQGRTTLRTLEELDIGRGRSCDGVDSHARWFEDENPYSKGLAKQPPSPSQWP